MKRRISYYRPHALRSWTLAHIVALLTAYSTAFAQEKPPPALDLAADARLQRKITLHEVGIPLNELFQQLSRNGLTLTPGRSCAMLRVHLRLEERPLHVLMQSLAQLLPGTWEAFDTGEGYRFDMEPKAIARRERWRRLFNEERAKAKEAQRQFLLARMRAEPFRRKPNDPNPENSDLAIEERVAQQQDFFRKLPKTLQEEIVNQRTDNPLELASNAMFGTENEEGAIIVPLKSLPEELRSLAQNRATAIFSTGNFPFQFENAVVSFTNGGFMVNANIITEEGRDTGAAFAFTAGMAPNAATLLLNHQFLAMVVKQLGRDAPATWKQLSEYQESRVWKNDLLKDIKRIHYRFRCHEVLDWLGEQEKMEFVADFYGNGGHPIPQAMKDQPLTIPLKEELDFQMADCDTSWRKSANNIYLFRNNRWYRDDFLEIPLPTLRRLYIQRQERDRAAPGETKKTVAQKLREQMDWEAEVLTTLSPWQIFHRLSSFSPFTLPKSDLAKLQPKRAEPLIVVGGLNPSADYPFRRDCDYLLLHFSASRFYASLDAPAREALIAGRLPLATLTPAQRERALYLLPKLRLQLAQGNNRPVYLRLVPRADVKFAQNGGTVRLVFSNDLPNDQ